MASEMKWTRTLASNLRVLRELRGRIGQADLAARVGISRRTVARLENDEVADPGVDQIRRIAAALEVPFEVLVDRSLVAVTLPLPIEIQKRLASKEGADLLGRIIRCVDDVPKRRG